MQEDFIVYLWQFQGFRKDLLQSTEGQNLEILRIGKKNPHAGADFGFAEILIDDLRWAGSVEFHVRSSDWFRHQHHENKSYDNVILHVVWEHDLGKKPILRQDQSPIPTLELRPLTDPLLIEKYHLLKNAQNPIPCSTFFDKTPKQILSKMLKTTLLQRLERKAAEIRQILVGNLNDWEQTAYQVLAKNMGFKVNAEPFAELSRTLPLKTIWKHTDQLSTIEALIFGQAGFLEKEMPDEYSAFLQREYRFYAYKYQLQSLNVEQWKFSKLHPPNFPTIRLAQFAALLQKRVPSFADMMQFESLQPFAQLFDILPSAYWQEHYFFGKKSKNAIGSLGKQSLTSLIINTIAPLMVVFGQEKDQKKYIDNALKILEETAAEDNKIIRLYADLGYRASNASDTQALIELHNEFCLSKRCLSCDIGTWAMRQDS